MKLLTGACAIAVLTVGAGLAQTVAVPPFPIEHYLLPNGLRVVFHVDRRAPVVHINIRYEWERLMSGSGAVASLICSST